jgi:MFS family permease
MATRDRSSVLEPSIAVARAVKYSYGQAIIGTVYGAVCGGMFITGYALKLGADNVQIGLLTSVPMLCVVVQLLSSALLERGVSRRAMTIVASLLSVLGWLPIILIPLLPADTRTAALIGLVTLITLFGNMAGNARWSWVGDLIPEAYRGTFFGRTTMYGGIVGAVFGLLGGHFLDLVQGQTVSAFAWLFAFGLLMGLVSTGFFVPQPDVPAPAGTAAFWPLVRATFANGPLMLVMLYALCWSLQAIAAPFYATYMLRDLHMSFLGLGAVSTVATLTMLLSSPFWGRMVDRYGCRPVLVACTGAMAPLPLVWIGLTTAHAVYLVLPAVHLLVGFASAGIIVALNTLIYKVIPPAGRAVQAAVYSILVTLAAAPMPALGGHLPDWLHRVFGVPPDLRYTFYAQIVAVTAAALVARRLYEPTARATRELLTRLPEHLWRPRTLGREEVTG